MRTDKHPEPSDLADEAFASKSLLLVVINSSAAFQAQALAFTS